MFQKAVKQEAKLRLAIAGPSGSGKTYTSLAIAQALGGAVAVVDTEHGSASKYADQFNFDVLEMAAPFHPDRFVSAIREATSAGYTTIVLDSLSHAWNGTGGLLELVEDAAKRMKVSNSFAAWRDVTPIQNRLIESIVAAPIHVIATMRSKQEYVQDRDERTGKPIIRKVGMAPVQRDGFEYEFDVVLDMDIENNAIVSKTRCSALAGRVFVRPGADVASILMDWLHGAPAPAPVNVQPPVAPPMAAPPTNGTGYAAPPAAKTAAPPVDLPPEVKFWEKPDDAYEWAVGIGASENVFAARNAMKSIVDAHGGRFTKENAATIYVAYYHDRMARAQEKAKAELDNMNLANVPEIDPEGVFA